MSWLDDKNKLDAPEPADDDQASQPSLFDIIPAQTGVDKDNIQPSEEAMEPAPVEPSVVPVLHRDMDEQLDEQPSDESSEANPPETREKPHLSLHDLSRKQKVIAGLTAGAVAAVGIGVAVKSSSKSAPKPVAATAKPNTTPTASSAPSNQSTPTPTAIPTLPVVAPSAPSQELDSNPLSSPINLETLEAYVQADKAKADSLVSQYPDVGLFLKVSNVQRYFDVSGQLTETNIKNWQKASNKVYAHSGAHDALSEAITDVLDEPNAASGLQSDTQSTIEKNLIDWPSKVSLAVEQSGSQLDVKSTDLLNTAFLPSKYLKQAKAVMSSRANSTSVDAPSSDVALLNAWKQTIFLSNGKTADITCYTAAISHVNDTKGPSIQVFAFLPASGDMESKIDLGDGVPTGWGVQLSPPQYYANNRQLAQDLGLTTK